MCSRAQKLNNSFCFCSKLISSLLFVHSTLHFEKGHFTHWMHIMYRESFIWEFGLFSKINVTKHIEHNGYLSYLGVDLRKRSAMLFAHKEFATNLGWG